MITRKMELFLYSDKGKTVTSGETVVTSNDKDVKPETLVRKYATSVDEKGISYQQYNVVFFGVKGITWENSITIDDITYPRSVFCSLKESSTDNSLEEDEDIDVDNVSKKKYAKDMDGYYINKNGTRINEGRLSEEGVELIEGVQNSYATGIDGIAMSINQRLSLIQGELYHFINEGFPLTSKEVDKNAFDAYLIRTVLHHPNVLRVINLQSKIEDHNYIAYINIATTAGNLNMTEIQEVD